MSELTMKQMTAQYLDVLKELGNIGAGNAMTALSQMISSKVDMSVPQVQLLEFKDVGSLMGGEEQIMVGVMLAVEGDITGSMMFLIERSSAKHLINKMMAGMVTEGDDFSEMEMSAIKEIGNIITAAYLNSLSTMTNLTIYPTPPEINVDMAAALLSVPAIEFGIYGDHILLIQSNFFDDVDMGGYFVLVPDLESYAKILTSLGLFV